MSVINSWHKNCLQFIDITAELISFFGDRNTFVSVFPEIPTDVIAIDEPL